MKQIIKTIGFGIVLGAAVFFVPFIFKFIFAVIIIGMVFRVFSRRRRHHRFAQHFAYHANHYHDIVPIDNQWYKPALNGNGPVQNININYQSL